MSRRLGHANLGQIIRGFKERLRYFAEVTYSGDPAAASPEIGEKTLDILAHLGADVMGDVWLGKDRSARLSLAAVEQALAVYDPGDRLGVRADDWLRQRDLLVLRRFQARGRFIYF